MTLWKNPAGLQPIWPSVRETSRRLGDRVQRLDIVAPVHGIVKGLAINTVGGDDPAGWVGVRDRPDG